MASGVQEDILGRRCSLACRLPRRFADMVVRGPDHIAVGNRVRPRSWATTWKAIAGESGDSRTSDRGWGGDSHLTMRLSASCSASAPFLLFLTFALAPDTSSEYVANCAARAPPLSRARLGH
eukprot:8614384-Pyramimonas_sp.AAC.1